MVRKRLPPGFRFHPTDVELILYYLKRKVMGKKLHYEAIAEVNLYKFSPWDLPDKSCLKNKDQEWFFFCPREKKYASGIRVKRATENGYWKTTGRDRKICCNEKTVGTVKTLVFHLGNAPKGERTDWIIHEYKILDEKLAEAGVQDTYVLCKVFKKNGPGPKNGAQYGAPFNEADWADDDVLDDEDDDGQNHTISLVPDNPSPPILLQNEEQSVPLESGLFGPGNTSGFPLLEEGPSHSVGGPTSEVVAGEADDEVTRLLAQFTDAMLGENGINQDDLSGEGMNDSLRCSDGLDVYNDLHDLDSWCQINEGRLDFSGLQNDGYSLNDMLPQDDSTYIELDDLLPPLHHPDGVTGTNQLALPEILGSSHSHDNIQHFHSGANFVGMNQYAACSNVLPLLPDGSNEGDNRLDVLQIVDNQIYQGANASYDSDFTFGQMENAVYPAYNMERVNSMCQTAGTCQFRKE